MTCAENALVVHTENPILSLNSKVQLTWKRMLAGSETVNAALVQLLLASLTLAYNIAQHTQMHICSLDSRKAQSPLIASRGRNPSLFNVLPSFPC